MVGKAGKSGNKGGRGKDKAKGKYENKPRGPLPQGSKATDTCVLCGVPYVVQKGHKCEKKKIGE